MHLAARPGLNFSIACKSRKLRCHSTVGAQAQLQTPYEARQNMAVPLSANDGKALNEVLSSVSTLVLDCDGVLWTGSTLLPGTIEALQHVRSLGKRLLFLTNNSSKSRRQYLTKFQKLGIQAAADEVVPTSYAAAAYLQSIGYSKRVFLIGNLGLKEEMELAGIESVTLEELSNCMAEPWTPDTFGNLQLDKQIGAVVIGYDPAFNYTKICYASACLRELPECLFICTNLDDADNIGNGRMIPGTGCSVRAVEAAAGRQAINVGKGGSWLLPFLCSKYDLHPESALIVGDRLDTDISMGLQGGLITVLPLTGVTRQVDLDAAAPGELPHFVIDNLAALAGIEI